MTSDFIRSETFRQPREAGRALRLIGGLRA